MVIALAGFFPAARNSASHARFAGVEKLSHSAPPFYLEAQRRFCAAQNRRCFNNAV
jgi:hypothetical protein